MSEIQEAIFTPEVDVRSKIEEMLNSAEPEPDRDAVKVKKDDVVALGKIQCVGVVERAKKKITQTAAYYSDADEYAYILNEVVDEVRQLLQSGGEGDMYNIESLILRKAKERYERKIYRRKVFKDDKREVAVGVVTVGLEDRPENLYLEAAIISEVPEDRFADLPILADQDDESGYKINMRYRGGKLRYQYYLDEFIKK